MTFSNGLSSDGNIWGAFGSYVGGLVGPIISVTGFYYVIASLNTAKVERHSDSILGFLGKIEQELDNILTKEVFALYKGNDNTFFARFELREFLRFHSTTRVEMIYFDQSKTVITNLEKEIQDIIKYLDLVKRRLAALAQLDRDSIDNVVEYYKTKYEILVDSLTNTQDRFAANYIMNWPQQGGRYKTASDSLKEVAGFYAGGST
jgi:hypothetical protein